MRYAHSIIQLLLIAPLLFDAAVATSPNDFQRMDNLPNLDCTTAWTTPMPYCEDSDFTNGAPCRPGCVYGVQSTQEGIQQVCQGAHYASGSLMGQFMAGNATGILCPNSGTTPDLSGNSVALPSVSSVSRPSSLAFPTAVASTVTSTITTTASLASSSVSSTSGSLTTTVVVQSTLVTHVTVTPSSTPNSTSSSASSSTSSSTSSSSSSTTSTSTFTSTATPSSSNTLTPSLSRTTTPATSGFIQTAVNGASVTVQGSTTSEFVHTAVNGGSVTVLSSKPAQTSSNNPDAFGGGGSPFEISSPASRSMCGFQRWTSVFVLGCMIWMGWV